MSSEMLNIGVDHVVFPAEEVEKLSMMPRAQRAAKYMTAMGLWRPPSGPGAIYSVTILTLLLSNKTLLTSGQDVQIM